MKKLLVILHIYYHDHLDYFIDKMKNINGCDWDLIVTYSEFNEQTVSKIREFKPEVRFIEADNLGYDVWPFIKAIKRTDIYNYEFIMKLHTKNTDNYTFRINGLKLASSQWRDLLVNSMLRTPKQFQKCIKTMQENEDIGMLCSYELKLKPSYHLPEDNHMLIDEVKRIGLRKSREPFCAGTMFLIRTVCLRKIRDAHFDPSMWGYNPKSHSKATLAHVYERVFGTATIDAGYKVKGIATYRSTAGQAIIHKKVSPVLKGILNIDYGLDSRKYVTLLGMKFPIKGKKEIK